MLPLDKGLRNTFERKIKEAREIAEEASQVAIRHLGVGDASPYSHLTDTERNLRRRLRAHGRQLGDKRDNENQTQEIDRLVEEVAYQHWHRMLFARFLAENQLLMYPDPDAPISITLEECEDLAAEEGAKNGWELASRFAEGMLPQIFRTDSPVFDLNFPPEHQQKLERLLIDLSTEIFTASDSLGWVYQFWQAKKKEEINESEVKIGAREIPAVTQLFTEPYMVNFLLDNSLGAWWAAQRLSELDLKNAKSEEELRGKISLPDLPFKYTRFIKNSKGYWTPAGGQLNGWPKSLREFKVLDPSCGSGHFLIAIINMLVPMRMVLEGKSTKAALEAVIEENIHGLDIDQRVVEIAAFAIALTVWKYPNGGGYRKLPNINLASSGLSVHLSKDDFKNINVNKKNLLIALKWIQREFNDASILGSLINPAKSEASNIVSLGEVLEVINSTLVKEQDEEEREMGITAQGIRKAFRLLTSQYDLVITNVPYLARGKQHKKLKEFCESKYDDAKNDLATVFLDRCIEFCKDGGLTSVVIPQNWLFLTTYSRFRKKLLRNHSINFLARLGAQAFQTPMWDFNVQLFTISKGNYGNYTEGLFANNGVIDEHGLIRGLDVSSKPTAFDKAESLKTIEISEVEQTNQLQNPDARILLANNERGTLFSEFAISMRGIVSGDNDKWVRKFWELPDLGERWRTLQSNPQRTRYFGGKEHIIDWSTNGKGMLRPGTTNEAYGRKGIAIGQMSSLPATLYDGSLYDNNTGAIVPNDIKDLLAMWCYCSSKEYHKAVREIDQKLNVTNATLIKVSFDVNYWRDVASRKYPNGLPKPYSDDPTQWIYHGNPSNSDNPLDVGVARLIGYRWPVEISTSIDVSDKARELISSSYNLESFVDSDGIVCIPSVLGEAPAADRLLNLLATSFGKEWSNTTLSNLLSQVDHSDKTLETWLRDKFFIQHCRIFHHRPFIWHIWDGLRDGFAALINYHKLDKKLLERLIFTYLGDWIKRQKNDADSGIDGAHEKLIAAQNLKKRLELILEGEAPYDIFVRWKSIEEQPIGWNPDINDGVRLNLRPFMMVPDIGKKGAGILRDKPNINWNKDRGKDVETAPWYHVFNGERINDYHLTLSNKMEARRKEKRTYNESN
ncbi:Eco57I restriction-modification methylase domain-containing protein [Neobacillus niacini]|uniref:Eco57I restriction-modification methylase domain-containing protein n=1 Tax=Neobacillus niacini TaxID=86668 RepID=UPI001C8F01E6|nr:N-6 DNA methylase [Neobacillus niacini]MBY0147754.1 N-6 DNA methylase [Neobacillus niacini]